MYTRISFNHPVSHGEALSAGQQMMIASGRPRRCVYHTPTKNPPAAANSQSFVSAERSIRATGSGCAIPDPKEDLMRHGTLT
jgi:hypothetical protein